MSERNLALRSFHHTKKQVKFGGIIKKNYAKRTEVKKKLSALRVKLLSGSVPSDEALAMQMQTLELQAFLDKSSRKSSVKYRKKCTITGHAHGVQWGLRRTLFRDRCSKGHIFGFVKGQA